MAPERPEGSPTPRGQLVPHASSPKSQKHWANRFGRLGTGPVKQRVWTVGRLLLLAGALSVTYGAFFLAAMRVATNAREVKVPDLRGKSVAEATDAVSRAGLALRVDPLRRPDPSVPNDHVLSQDPSPGTVLRRQRAVRVRVSDGSKAPVLPSVVGQFERDAEAVLAQEHISIVGRAEVQTSEYPAGTVVAQDPPAKSRSSGITLLVNRGESTQRFVMPDLIGTFGERVAGLMRAADFRVSIVGDAPYPGLPAGIVVRQTPQAGFQIGLKDAISLEVSR